MDANAEVDAKIIDARSNFFISKFTCSFRLYRRVDVVTITAGVFQVSWHWLLTIYATSLCSFSGFKSTRSIGAQQRTSPDQRL
ncbi:hypothetical protein, partial [Vibrio breoganii]|uniref:hypothetical protein n=1 Tax=Vibrio breoganii TaxID=553239 RepID=UPI001B7D4CCD